MRNWAWLWSYFCYQTHLRASRRPVLSFIIPDFHMRQPHRSQPRSSTDGHASATWDAWQCLKTDPPRSFFSLSLVEYPATLAEPTP